MSYPKGVSSRRTRQDILVGRVHYSADPERDPATETGKLWYIVERKKYSSQGAWDREQEIMHEAGGGELVFAAILRKYAHKIIIDDPSYQISKHWRPVPGFDHGKSNPTAGLQAWLDFDGNIILCGEYYQPSVIGDDHNLILGPSDHCRYLRQIPGYFEADAVMADPSIFDKTQAQSDSGGNSEKFKSVAQLYSEAGGPNFRAARNAEQLGMEWILHHWRDLDTREPSLKIVCRMTYDRPNFGLFPHDCPNTLWELMRARREKLTAVQLMRKNPSEKLVDKDNHLRDCLKYIVLSLPDPTEKPIDMRFAERTAGMDELNRSMTRVKMIAEERKAAAPILRGGTALRRNVFGPPRR